MTGPESEVRTAFEQLVFNAIEIGRDKFGDNGLVGAAIIANEGDVARIDTLLLSCRVMGRTVETAILAFLVEQAKESGARLLMGEYIPTKKNAVVEHLYAEHGFERLDEDSQFWQLDLHQGDCLAYPAYFTMELPA